MKKKVLLMTLIGLVLLGAVIAAALNAVFTVTDVEVHYASLSQAGTEDSYALQARLEEAYIGKSTTFVDLEEVKRAVGEFPAFRVERAEKRFPATLVLEVAERRETFAFRREDGMYAVLDETGVYLYDNAENSNRRLGENLLLDGFSLTAEEAGVPAAGDCFETVLAFCDVFIDSLDDIRANMLSIRLLPTENEIEGDYKFRIEMKEGLVVDVYKPSVMTEEKAQKVLEEYLALSDAQKMYGFFDVVDTFSGEISASKHRAELPI